MALFRKSSPFGALSITQVEAIVQDYIDNQPGVTDTKLDSFSINGKVIDFILSDGAVKQLDITSTFSGDITNVDNKVDATNTVVSALDTLVQSIDSRVGTLETDLTNTNSDVTALTTRVSTSETDISDLQTDVGSLQTTASSLDNRVGVAEADISALSSTSLTQASQISDLQSEVSGNSSDISTNTNNISNLSSSLTTLDGEVTGIDGRLITAESEIDTIESDIDSLQSTVAQLVSDNTTNQNEIALLELEQPEFEKILKTPQDFQNIQSGISYLIDGEIDFTGTGITIPVPAGGLTIRGLGVDVSKLKCSDDNYTLFSGSGNFFCHEGMTLEVSGVGSSVFDLTSTTGFSAASLDSVNFSGCTSLGQITSFRQVLATNTQIFGCGEGITYNGPWAGGIKFTDFLIRSSGFTGPIFKQGTNFSLSSRFSLTCNADMTASQGVFCDFQSTIVSESSNFQLTDCIFKQNGSPAVPGTFFPNASQGDVGCFWRENVGILNTKRGFNLISSVNAFINTQAAGKDVYTPVTGINFSQKRMQHFTLTEASVGGAPSGLTLTYQGPSNLSAELDIFLLIGQQGGFGDSFTVQLRKYNTLSSTNFTVVEEFSSTVNKISSSANIGEVALKTTSELLNGNVFQIWVASNEDTPTNHIMRENSSIIADVF